MVLSNPVAKTFTYERRKPEATTLYKLVQTNWLSFKDQVYRENGYPLPDFVIKEFEEYLKCGILAHGFLRARPAISEERLSTNSVGDVVYRFKKPWDDGTSAIKLTPMEFMEKLAALVPRPRVHLTRFHGVLGPHYKYRKLIVPAKPQLTVVADNADPTTVKRISWARLLKRIFNIDIQICPKCQGPVKITTAVEDPIVIKKILEHLGLSATAPKILPATGPPLFDQDNFKQESYDF